MAAEFQFSVTYNPGMLFDLCCLQSVRSAKSFVTGQSDDNTGFLDIRHI